MFLTNLFLSILFPYCLAASPIIIGIAGASGSGKTTFVQEARSFFFNEPSVLCMDNYYRDFSDLPFEARKNINFDDPKNIDFDFLEEQIMQIKNGETINQPVYDFISKTRSKDTLPCKPTPVVFIEGFLLLAYPEICQHCDLKIFLDVSEVECLFRIIQRDQQYRNTSFVEIKQRYIDFVQPTYRNYIQESRYQADLIIPKGRENKRAFEIFLHAVRAIQKGEL